MSTYTPHEIEDTQKPLLSKNPQKKLAQNCNFSPTQDQIEKMDLLKMELDLLLADEDRIKFESVQNSRFMTRIIKLKSLMNWLKKYGLWEIVEQEQARHQEQKNKKRPRKDTRTGAKYLTLKRQALLNSVIETPNQGATFYANEARFSRSRCLIALKDLSEQGYLVQDSTPTGNFFSPTDKARDMFLDRGDTFWHCSITSLRSRNQCQNVSPSSKMSLILECAQSVTKKLLSLGWWHRNIQRAISLLGVSEIMKKIKEVEEKESIKNKGAYLHRVLLGTKKQSLENIGKSILKSFTEEIQEEFVAQAQEFKSDMKKVFRLAFSIKKAGTKKRTRWGTEGKKDSLPYQRNLTRVDVLAIKDWIRKEEDRIYFAKRKGV